MRIPCLLFDGCGLWEMGAESCPRSPRFRPTAATVWWAVSLAFVPHLARAPTQFLVFVAFLFPQNPHVRGPFHRSRPIFAPRAYTLASFYCNFVSPESTLWWAGSTAFVTLISPLRKDREKARKLHEARGIPFLEVFVDVPLSVAQERDPKGLYKKVPEPTPDPPLAHLCVLRQLQSIPMPVHRRSCLMADCHVC